MTIQLQLKIIIIIIIIIPRDIICLRNMSINTLHKGAYYYYYYYYYISSFYKIRLKQSFQLFLSSQSHLFLWGVGLKNFYALLTHEVWQIMSKVKTSGCHNVPIRSVEVHWIKNYTQLHFLSSTNHTNTQLQTTVLS